MNATKPFRYLTPDEISLEGVTVHPLYGKFSFHNPDRTDIPLAVRRAEYERDVPPSLRHFIAINKNPATGKFI